MDVHAWLSATKDRHPPESTPPRNAKARRDIHRTPLVGHFRSKQQHITAQHEGGYPESSFIQPLIAQTVDPEHWRPPSPGHIAHHHDAFDAQTSSSSSTPNGISASSDDPYKRQPRRKTRPDRYDPKLKNRKKQTSNKPTKRRRHGGDDTDRRNEHTSTGRVRQALKAKGPSNSRRLTLQTKDHFGLFRHGKVSGHCASGQDGVPDLTFNEMSFLRRAPTRDCDANMGLEARRNPTHQAEEQHISNYFGPGRQMQSLHDSAMLARVSHNDPHNEQSATIATTRCQPVEDDNTTGTPRIRSSVHKGVRGSHDTVVSPPIPLIPVHSSSPACVDNELLDLMVGSKRVFAGANTSLANHRTSDILDIFSRANRKEHERSTIDLAREVDEHSITLSRLSADPASALLNSGGQEPSEVQHNAEFAYNMAMRSGNTLYSGQRQHSAINLPVRDLFRFQAASLCNACPHAMDLQVSASNFQLWRVAVDHSSPAQAHQDPHWALRCNPQPRRSPRVATMQPPSQESLEQATTSLWSEDHGTYRTQTRTEYSVDDVWQQERQHANTRVMQSNHMSCERSIADPFSIALPHDSTQVSSNHHFWRPNRLY